jgi:hypothetical protein
MQHRHALRLLRAPQTAEARAAGGAASPARYRATLCLKPLRSGPRSAAPPPPCLVTHSKRCEARSHEPAGLQTRAVTQHQGSHPILSCLIKLIVHTSAGSRDPHRHAGGRQARAAHGRPGARAGHSCGQGCRALGPLRGASCRAPWSEGTDTC